MLVAATARLSVEVPRWLQVTIWIAGIAITLTSAALHVIKGGYDSESDKLHVWPFVRAALEAALAIWAILQIPAMVRGTWHAPTWFRVWNQTSDTVHIAIYHVILVILIAVALAAGFVGGIVIGIKERDWDVLRTTLGIAVMVIVLGAVLHWMVGFFDPLLRIIGWLL